ncbi:MAG: electron transfer flavoprotein-ubiquinone oxidoreductase [Alphaproteobacteria bacterium]|nr:electron transfer flavoprotein-ubiquinone oxidoreductase [Alphaproteobacteria bacterium]
MTAEARTDRESMEFDVVIVGAGPAGLSCAIRLRQHNPGLSVCIVEKGSEVGAHLLSGAVLETRALDELIPDWREMGAPVKTAVTKDRLLLLTKNRAIPMPAPPQMHNRGNFIISLCNLSRWLGDQAESIGVEIFPGFAAAEILYDDTGAVRGVATGDVGLDRDGKPSASFEPGVELLARQTIFAEGAHGSLTKQLIEKFDLRKDSDPQTYGLGVKEIWKVAPEMHREGLVVHTIGWPLDNWTYGGSFLYHMEDCQVAVGLVVGLDYENPHLSPFEEMQRFKLHPAIRPTFEGGKRVAYGARALVEGGFQSLPKLTFPGGLLIGDTAGFLNVPKIKGNHMAMKSGMVAAEALADLFRIGNVTEATSYPERLKRSWLWTELKKVRNIRPGFKYGLYQGLVNAAFETATFGLAPWTLKNQADYAQLKKLKDVAPIDYPRPDGTITFDRASSVWLSNTNHAEDQPCHLRLKDPAIPVDVNLPEYGEPAQNYCPAGVYEIITDDDGRPKFQINAQNCVHCKTCDIKDPSQNIIWTVPQGGDGPNYPNM